MLFEKKFKTYLFIVYKYTVAVFRHTRRGHQISLQMVVNHLSLLGFELRTSERAVSALPKILSSNPSNHVVAHIYP